MPDESPPGDALADAVAGFDAELTTYARLGELFIKTPLASVKQLERANATLADIAKCEERLQAAGQRMVQALSIARGHQEQLAAKVVAHVPAVQARNQQLNELMAELTTIVGEGGSLNQAITSPRENGDASKPHTPTADETRDIIAKVLALSDRAERLAATANAAEFEELATQAHSIHQRLAAVGKKLQKASGA
ncbi:MAG TPA: hypothetical protein VFP84_27595 [Kofleriaceae bacterium]|nr:hypothetical protein [Kofleriaceae bacterium]